MLLQQHSKKKKKILYIMMGDGFESFHQKMCWQSLSDACRLVVLPFAEITPDDGPPFCSQDVVHYCILIC